MSAPPIPARREGGAFLVRPMSAMFLDMIIDDDDSINMGIFV